MQNLLIKGNNFSLSLSLFGFFSEFMKNLFKPLRVETYPSSHFISHSSKIKITLNSESFNKSVKGMPRSLILEFEKMPSSNITFNKFFTIFFLNKYFDVLILDHFVDLPFKL